MVENSDEKFGIRSGYITPCASIHASRIPYEK